MTSLVLLGLLTHALKECTHELALSVWDHASHQPQVDSQRWLEKMKTFLFLFFCLLPRFCQ